MFRCEDLAKSFTFSKILMLIDDAKFSTPFLKYYKISKWEWTIENVQLIINDLINPNSDDNNVLRDAFKKKKNFIWKEKFLSGGGGGKKKGPNFPS